MVKHKYCWSNNHWLSTNQSLHGDVSVTPDVILSSQMVCNGSGPIRHRHPHRPAGHQRLERPGSRAQEVVSVPHQHAPRADQGDQRGGRKPAGRGNHLVQRGLSPNSAAELASRVHATGDPPKTWGDGFCAWSVKKHCFLMFYFHPFK